MQASRPPLLATSATSNRAAVGSGIGAVWRPCPARLVRRGKSGAWAGLASVGGSADAPACGQAVGAKLARLDVDFGRALWMRGNPEPMNGKDLSDRNTFFICDTDERGLGLEENLHLFSLIGGKMFEASRLFFGGKIGR